MRLALSGACRQKLIAPPLAHVKTSVTKSHQLALALRTGRPFSGRFVSSDGLKSNIVHNTEVGSRVASLNFSTDGLPVNRQGPTIKCFEESQ